MIKKLLFVIILFVCNSTFAFEFASLHYQGNQSGMVGKSFNSPLHLTYPLPVIKQLENSDNSLSPRIRIKRKKVKVYRLADLSKPPDLIKLHTEQKMLYADIDYDKADRTIARSTHCFIEASRKYGLPLSILPAIAKVESGGRRVRNKNKNGTSDWGAFQINDIWMPQLKKYGISKNDLYKGDICISIGVAAWILRQAINDAKGNFWLGVGYYHSKTPKYYQKYIPKVYEKAISIEKDLYKE